MINYAPKVFVVVGGPASGKDELIQAVNTLGGLHAKIISKHTDRKARLDDEEEMICQYILGEDGNFIKNPSFDISHCDIIYTNYGTKYGIKTNDIWEGLKSGVHQVLVVSNIKALNELKHVFGDNAIFIYVHSEFTKEEYMKKEKTKISKQDSIDESSEKEYLAQREKNFDMAWKLYENNFMLFNHVFIYTNKKEDLFDQIFRLFRYYENRVS